MGCILSCIIREHDYQPDGNWSKTRFVHEYKHDEFIYPKSFESIYKQMDSTAKWLKDEVKKLGEIEKFKNVEGKNAGYKLNVEYNDKVIEIDQQFKTKLPLLLSPNSDWLEEEYSVKHLCIQKDFRAVYDIEEFTWFLP
jgi:hypothetical protein